MVDGRDELMLRSSEIVARGTWRVTVRVTDYERVTVR
jgi:hypothetical protein